jgi:hypothetical protein
MMDSRNCGYCQWCAIGNYDACAFVSGYTSADVTAAHTKGYELGLSQKQSVEQCIVDLVEALQQSKGWLYGYGDAVIRDAIDRTHLQDEGEPVAEIIECPRMGQQTVQEIDGRWKFLPYGTKLYTAACTSALAEPAAEVVSNDICQDHEGRIEAFQFLLVGTKLYASPPQTPQAEGAIDARERLTDEQIESLADAHTGKDAHGKSTGRLQAISFARAVLALASLPEAPSAAETPTPWVSVSVSEEFMTVDNYDARGVQWPLPAHGSTSGRRCAGG